MGHLYKWLYTRIGGRPWTYITRQWTQEHVFESLILATLVGVVLGEALSLSDLAHIGVVVAIGVIIGHLFWSTKGEHIR